jgi:hypothetical protein
MAEETLVGMFRRLPVNSRPTVPVNTRLGAAIDPVRTASGFGTGMPPVMPWMRNG